MAIIERHTGFEGCNSDADVRALIDGGAYSVSFTRYSANQGLDGGKCIYGIDGGSYPFHWNVSPAKTKVVGFHVKGLGVRDYNTAPSHALVRMSVGSSLLSIFNTYSGLKLYRDAVLISSSATVIDPSQHHVEFKIFSDAANGTFALKLDGVEVAFDNTAGLNTTGNDITQVLWGNAGTANVYYDNLFVADDWVGELKHYKVIANSDHSVAMTPTSGTDNYAMVATNDRDTTTVSGGSGTKDLYGYEDLPAGITVKSVAIVTVAKKDDVGTVVLNVLAKQDSAEYEVASHALATDYPSGVGTALQKILSTQPDGTPWGDSSTFNDIYWGFEVD